MVDHQAPGLAGSLSESVLGCPMHQCPMERRDVWQSRHGDAPAGQAAAGWRRRKARVLVMRTLPAALVRQSNPDRAAAVERR